MSIIIFQALRQDGTVMSTVEMPEHHLSRDGIVMAYLKRLYQEMMIVREVEAMRTDQSS